MKDASTSEKNHLVVLQLGGSDKISDVGVKFFIDALDLISCSCKCRLAYYLY